MAGAPAPTVARAATRSSGYCRHGGEDPKGLVRTRRAGGTAYTPLEARVSPRLIWMEFLDLFAGFVVLTAACAVGWYLLGQPWIWAGAGALAVLMVVRLFFLRRSIRSWGYAERADDLLVRHGLMIRRLSI